MKRKKSDVIIIGAGPLGWACAQLLAQKKVKTTIVDPCNPATPSSWMRKGLGVFWPSLNDPPTRAVVAHGLDMATWLQNFCQQGCIVAQKILGKENLRAVPAFRIGLEQHETVELQSAHGFGFGLQPRSYLGEEYFIEKNSSFILKPDSNFEEKFENSNFISGLQTVAKKVSESKDGCQIFLENGQTIESEMAIVANGYQISEFEPWLTAMLIPMSDVFSIWKTNIPCHLNSTPITLRASSGHVAAILTPTLTTSNEGYWTLKITGPRFLLPGAGAGVNLSHQTPDHILAHKIESWVKDKLIPKILPLIQTKNSNSTQNSHVSLELQAIRYGVDCLPCDELPMLGELGLQGRMLGATGWLGCGWSAGFQAAQILSELVLSGRSEKLKPLLRPQRWRRGLDNNEGGVTGMT